MLKEALFLWLKTPERQALMGTNKRAYYILLFSGAILFGNGLYRFVAPQFWDANPFYYRLVTLFTVIIGTVLLLLAYRMHKAHSE